VGYLKLTVSENHDRLTFAYVPGLHYTWHELAARSHVTHQSRLKSHPERNLTMYKVLILLHEMLNDVNSFQFLNKSPFHASFLNRNLFVVQAFALLVAFLPLP